MSDMAETIDVSTQWQNDTEYTLTNVFRAAKKCMMDDTEIIGSTIPKSILDQYPEAECVRCYYCNNNDPRQYAPIAVWTSNYIYFIDKDYDAHYDAQIPKDDVRSISVCGGKNTDGYSYKTVVSAFATDHYSYKAPYILNHGEKIIVDS